METQAIRSDPLWYVIGWVGILTALFAWRTLSSGITGSGVLAVVIVALTLFLYLMMGWQRGGSALRQWALGGPGRVFVIPVSLWVLALLYAQLNGHVTDEVGVLGLALTLIPVEMARRELRPVQPKDLLWGWLALLIPLMNPPFGHNIPLMLDVGMRFGAFLLPALYIWLARGRWQRVRLLLAFSYIWYSVEWATPDVGFPAFSLFHLYALGLAVYILILSGESTAAGLGLTLRWEEIRPVFRNFVFFLPFALTIGLAAHFLHPHWPTLSGLDMLLRGVFIFFFTGLPEEILFRGVIFRTLTDYLGKSRQALALSAVIFGAAHLNNPPMVGIYFILATLAGWFYGDTYLRTGRIAPAALLHTLVDWVWDLFL